MIEHARTLGARAVGRLGARPPLEPVGRALTLLEAACPEMSADELASLSIGRRDADLLSLREWAFGSEMTGVAAVCRDAANNWSSPSAWRKFAAICRTNGTRLRAAGGWLPFASTSPEQSGFGGDRRTRRYRSSSASAVRTLFDRGFSRGKPRLGRPVAGRRLRRGGRGYRASRPAGGYQASDSHVRLAITRSGHLRHLAPFWSEIEYGPFGSCMKSISSASAYGWREHEFLALSRQAAPDYLEMTSG